MESTVKHELIEHLKCFWAETESSNRKRYFEVEEEYLNWYM